MLVSTPRGLHLEHVPEGVADSTAREQTDPLLTGTQFQLNGKEMIVSAADDMSISFMPSAAVRHSIPSTVYAVRSQAMHSRPVECNPISHASQDEESALGARPAVVEHFC